MKIIIGLGNPTREYEATRHNIGFDAVTRLCDDYNIRMDTRQHKALCGKGYIGGEKVLLVQPQTYMNLSGESVRAAADFYKVEAEDLIVLCDDINLEVGQLRVRPKGSAGGHNGLKNIIAHLGHDSFIRVKMGVGEKPRGYDLADYVLGHFPAGERKAMDEAVVRAAEAIRMILAQDVDAAMNAYNRKQNPQP